MYKIVTLFILVLFSNLSKAQDILLSENFDLPTAPALPSQWSTTFNYDIGFRTDSTNFSDQANASGNKNIVIRNSDSTGVYTLYSPIFSTLNHIDVNLMFASRVSNNYLTPGSTTPTLEYSPNGGASWYLLSYTDNEANSTWTYVNGETPIALPSDAWENPYVQLRWTVNIVNDPSGTYRIDDVVVMGSVNPVITLTVLVNMSNETVSGDGVFIAGDFNGWDNGSNIMTEVGGGIYQYVIETYQNTSMKFRFYNGGSGNSEIVLMDCGVDDQNGNGDLARNVDLLSENVVYGPVCFNECADCIIVEPVLVNLNFRVDMSQQDISANGVHIVGNFQGWDASSTPMVNIGNGVYEYTAEIQEGTQVLYRFVNGNSLADAELLSGSCSLSDGEGNFNRYTYTGSEDDSIAVVCYSECAACVPESVDEYSPTPIVVYPNPSTDFITIQSNEIPAGTNIKVIDINGKMIIDQTMNVSKRIDVSDLNPGVYTLICMVRSGLNSSVFIKQ